MKDIKNLAQDWLPPAIVRCLQYLLGSKIEFRGNFSAWEDAASLSEGYDKRSILAKVLKASLKVKQGYAGYERDSVLFNRIDYSWPVTAGLMWVAAQNDGKLWVIDFGGSLGSVYFQNRIFLSTLSNVRWSVIEQDHYVRVGNKYIADDRLRFYENAVDSLKVGCSNVILLSSVLQYVSDPRSILNLLLGLGVEFLIFDRTPFLNTEGKSVIKIQSIPSSIYSASYPCWFFEAAELIDLIESAGYKLIESFDSLDRLSNSASWRGYIFKKIAHK